MFKISTIFWFKPRRFSKSVIFLNKETPAEVYAEVTDEYDLMVEQQEAALEKSRNKSRLTDAHRNILHGKVPYKDAMAPGHLTLLYKRKMFGRYGSETGLDPGTLWPTRDEMKMKLDYENVAYPYSIQKLIEIETEKKEKEYNEILERQKKISQNLAKLAGWKREIKARVEKKAADIAAAKAKKDAMIEEVRRLVGYKVDPKDEKFKEMLLKKEKETKKKAKEEKIKLKRERLVAQMLKSDKSE